MSIPVTAKDLWPEDIPNTNLTPDLVDDDMPTETVLLAHATLKLTPQFINVIVQAFFIHQSLSNYRSYSKNFSEL